ncbi:lopap-like [Cydia fagiglandana]|uniref:lopap-like n=1 Tax=Cydia fagiglandana TaxID=1458189 RepID=UPI002FEE194F
MDKIICCVLAFICFIQCLCVAQILKFGTCPDVKTMKYFELEKFLGVWYEIERFPTWYEDQGDCAYKRISACGRHIEIEHVYVKDGIEYVLHVNTTYSAGDEAVFVIQESNIDPMGIPISVLTTDYTNYAVIYGCRNSEEMNLMYISAWIASRSSTLDPETLDKARRELSSIPFASAAYLERVEQEKCSFHWTAHVEAVVTHVDEES